MTFVFPGRGGGVALRLERSEAKIWVKSQVKGRQVSIWGECSTYQGHELAGGALSVEILGSLNADGVLFGSQRGKHDVGAIGVNDLADLVHTAEQDAIDLLGGDDDVFDEQAEARENVVDLLLSSRNALGVFSRDEDLVWVPRSRVGRAVAEDGRERRRHVDGGPGGRLDQLDALAVTAAQGLMESELESQGVDDSAELT